MKRLVVVLALTAAVAASAQADSKKRRAAGDGSVNWVGQVVKATGSGAPDLRAQNPAQARLGAERAAQLDAFRNLLAQVKGIQVSAGKTVGEEMERDEVRGKVEGLLRDFKVTDKRYFSDGGVEMDVEVPLAAIAGVFLPEPDATAEKPALNDAGEKKITGLVVDARGHKLTPALAPRLVDEQGKALYGAEFLGEEARRQGSVAAWARTLDEAKGSQRVGDKPLVLKASKVKGTDLILGGDAAKKLLESNNGFLAEGRVVIVTQ